MRARCQERVHLHPPARHKREPQLPRPVTQILAQVLAQMHEAPIFFPTHGDDANTRGLVFRALLNNDGTREVRFERVAVG